MTLTNRKLIESAYRAVGLNAAIFDLTPDDLQNALDDLGPMLAGWAKKGIRISYAGGGIEDESGIPDYAVEAVTLNFGIKLGEQLGKQIAPNASGNAKRAYNDLLTATAQTPNVRRDVDYVPSGAGNYNWDGRITLVPDPEPLTTGKDGPLNLG